MGCNDMDTCCGINQIVSQYFHMNYYLSLQTDSKESEKQTDEKEQIKQEKDERYK